MKKITTVMADLSEDCGLYHELKYLQDELWRTVSVLEMEDKFHLTLLWGIYAKHEEIEPVLQRLNRNRPLPIVAGKLGFFSLKNWDVLRLEILPTPEISAFRCALEDFPFTKTFEWNPHITLARVSKNQKLPWYDDFLRFDTGFLDVIRIQSKSAENGKEIKRIVL